MRSLITFTFLALVVVLGFQLFYKPKPSAPAPPAQNQTQPQTQTQAPNQPQTPPSAASGANGQTQPSAGAAPLSVGAPTISASMLTETTVENENYKIVLTNRGAQATHWILNRSQYKDHPDPGGKQLDLVNPRTASFGLPLEIYTYEPELTRQLNEALYQVTVAGAASSTGVLRPPASVTYHYAANGLDAVKTFRFDQSYVVTAELQVRRNGAPVRAMLAWPGGLGDQTEPTQFAYGKFIWSVAGKDDSTDAKKVSNNATIDQPFEYAAISDLYFAAALLPETPSSATLVTLHSTIDLPATPGDPNSQKKPVDVIGLAMGDSSGTTRLRVFAGPKETELLKGIHATGADGKATGPSLESLIQYGWFTIIAKPLYIALRFLRVHLGPGAYNWGWAIIIFTALFNLIMLPTRFMMMRSSLKMMRIQSKVEALKKRYAHLKATDPKRSEMNAEMMALYKTEGVNPYGGCLPMLLQMPLFFAYYRVLYNAVELRQAQWFWLHDLSVSDPMYVLPGIIIVTMFITQIITPSPGMDPAQRRMMAFLMPVMMGFMLGHFASGLALYWATGNIINLAIQIGINQSSLGKEMHEIAAKRAAKKTTSAPKTIQGKR